MPARSRVAALQSLREGDQLNLHARGLEYPATAPGCLHPRVPNLLVGLFF